MDYKEMVTALLNSKELSSEQKAKLEEIFPEVKESEDERIKEAIIATIHLYYGEPLEDEAKEMIAWLEKQGEQKFSDIDNIIRVRETKPKDISEFLDRLTTVEQEFLWLHIAKIRELDKEEQNPSNKVEPKFHEGDWIIHHGTENIYQVVARINNQYQLKYSDNYTIQNCVDVDRCSRLYDVAKDAKDGDVLNSMRVQATIIFKGLADDGKHILAYCALQKGIFIKQVMLWDRDFEPCPKNWNNELFSKMKEAGYEWDAEKKELRKIEQNTTWSEEDDRMYNRIVSFIPQHLTAESYTACINWLKSLKDRVQPQPKYEWSKEDEEQFSFCCAAIELSNYSSDEYRNCAISFLESLKDRIQPKQEWSEEDEQMIKNVQNDYYNRLGAGIITQAYHDKIISWLKSLRPQSQWKPSDEQMDILDMVLTNESMDDNVARILRELREQLKKLKE